MSQATDTLKKEIRRAIDKREAELRRQLEVLERRRLLLEDVDLERSMFQGQTRKRG